jgi:predicted nucleic acid-binding protein
MPDKAFLDTNILVYAFTSNDPRKAIAEDLVVQGASIGVQTLNEFISVERTKTKVPWPTVLDWLRIIHALCPPPIPVTMETHHRGLQIAQACGYHIYDSLMLAAALEASCTIFYSEDMQDGQTIDTLTIRNPFATRKHTR